MASNFSAIELKMEEQHFVSSAFSLEFYIYLNYQSSAKVGKH